MWWFSKTSPGETPTKLLTFKDSLSREIIPTDYAKRARDRLRKLKQFKSVSKYLAKFRNIIISVPGICDDDKADRFVDGLNHNIRLEVLKAHTQLFDHCARVALNIDNAL